MQSHTFTRARGVPILGSASTHRLHDTQQPSTSGSHLPRSSSLNPRQKKKVDPSLPPTYIHRFHDEESVRRMTYRRVGRTDMYISKVSFGSGPLGGMFGPIEESTTQIVETALRQGVNFIDTAYWYAQARSESILGKILSKVPRRAYYIATKVGRFELDYARSFDFRADKILESLTQSLKKLRLTYIDVCFVQIHDADFEPNASMLLFETLQALDMARQSGKIRYIGLTGYPLDKMTQVIEHSPIQIDVAMPYCHGCMNDNSLGEHVQHFQSRSVAVLNASPLSMGLLSLAGPPQWHPASELIKETTAAAAEYCRSKNLSLARIALHYALHFPGCVSCVVGFASIQQVREVIDLAVAGPSGGLSDIEQRVRDRVMRRYMDGLDNAGWAGVDVTLYWRRLKRLGLTALATPRHASVESLGSTLNGLSMYSSRSPSTVGGVSRSPSTVDVSRRRGYHSSASSSRM